MDSFNVWYLAGFFPALMLVVFILTKFFVNVKSTELATIEKKYFGKEMGEGRTVALPGEVGVQARILGPAKM